MGQFVRLTASDGHEFGAYRADPAGTPRGGVVVLQEIFGVNSHIRAMCDRIAAEGYIAIAPALFDRFVRDFESGYAAEDIEVARQYLVSLDWEALLRDTRAAIDAIAPEAGPVSLVGYCLGGSLAFLGATRFSDINAAVSYYGGQIVPFADAPPLRPTLMHFGETDFSIPLSDVDSIAAKRPDVELHRYPAGHGFNCDERASFEPESAAKAWQRSLDFIAKAEATR